MRNAEIADHLRQLADLLEIKGEAGFRANAYRRAADAIRQLPEPVTTYAEQGTLTDLPGIGAGIAAAIEELLATGRLAATDELLGDVPATLLTLLELPGVGPKTVGRLYRELGITDISQLETAARGQQVRALKGLGARQEQRILEGIAFLNRRSGRVSIGIALPTAEALRDAISQATGARVEIAGSTRRMCETVGNIDLVVAGIDASALETLLSQIPGVADAARAGEGLVGAQIVNGASVRLVLTDPATFGAALVRWTGSAAHVRRLIERAGGRLPDLPEEALVYDLLGLRFIPPELREARDEIDRAASGTLPRLIETSDIRGDLHLHSTWSDGRATIEELAELAREIGYEYLCIADHSFGLAIANGLDQERLLAQRREIERVNERVPELRLLRASEVEVHLDGTLDFPDEVLAELDVVVASLHSGLRLPAARMTERIVRVLENPHVDIVAHPTGRIVDRRPGATYDWEMVFRVARDTGTALEINANPVRLDLNEDLARAAIEAGVTLAINSDAHDRESLRLMRFGVAVARRAGVGPAAVINTRPLPELLAWLGR